MTKATTATGRKTAAPCRASSACGGHVAAARHCSSGGRNAREPAAACAATARHMRRALLRACNRRVRCFAGGPSWRCCVCVRRSRCGAPRRASHACSDACPLQAALSGRPGLPPQDSAVPIHRARQANCAPPLQSGCWQHRCADWGHNASGAGAVVPLRRRVRSIGPPGEAAGTLQRLSGLQHMPNGRQRPGHVYTGRGAMRRTQPPAWAHTKNAPDASARALRRCSAFAAAARGFGRRRVAQSRMGQSLIGAPASGAERRGLGSRRLDTKPASLTILLATAAFLVVAVAALAAPEPENTIASVAGE